MFLLLANPLLKLWRIALNPAENGTWINLNAALLHHLSQVSIPDAVLAIPAQHSKMISTGKRRRLKIDNRTAPRLAALH